jgi:hypothetical protein
MKLMTALRDNIAFKAALNQLNAQLVLTIMNGTQKVFLNVNYV